MERMPGGHGSQGHGIWRLSLSPRREEKRFALGRSFRGPIRLLLSLLTHAGRQAARRWRHKPDGFTGWVSRLQRMTLMKVDEDKCRLWINAKNLTAE
jgi:hypothetical protein